ncbi:phosphocarrier protein [Saccharopolyspora lacisalsi]|uniref:Phosphocarrier protein HPr n=1 Tax=Halosaccharopolyspora lacisalsi TaxID=1000566 RepID=A0A839DY75_9PSEU|nr:HPr family phosphocarrier protein [Halosaccharopolyspora lacisalsi]MBA8823708.1 phosphocarrier protein [Halosaccharopolyspora lacisalsi]
MPSRRATVAAKVGLHARPAAMLAKFAGAQDFRVTIAKVERGYPGSPVDAGSVLGLMGLGAEQGDEVELDSEGPDAENALDQLVALLERDLDDEPAPTDG